MEINKINPEDFGKKFGNFAWEQMQIFDTFRRSLRFKKKL